MNGSKMTLSDNDKNSFIQNHIKIIANGVNITAGGSFKPTPNNNPDTIQYVCESGYKFEGDVYTRYRVISTGVLERPKMTDTSNTVKTFISNKAVNFSPLCNDLFNKDGVAVPYMKIVQDSVDDIPVSASLNNCILSPVVSAIPKGSASNFTITADNGFKFTSSPSVYTLAGGVTSAVQVTKVSDYEYTFNVTPAETDESLNIYAYAVSETVNFIKTLSNCSVSPAGNTLTIGVPVTVSITANSGYIFDAENLPVLYWIDTDEIRHEIILTKVSDYEYNATFTPYEIDYYLDASAIAEHSSTPLEKNLTNASLSPNISAVTVGVTTQIDVVANNGYYFDENNEPILYIPYGNEGDQTTVNGTRIDETTYRFSVTTNENDIKLKFVADAVQIPASTPLEKNLTNASLSPDISSLVLNETYTLTVTANAGYRFDVAPSLRYLNGEGTIIYYEPIKISNYEYRFNNVSYNNTSKRYYTLTATANAESQTSEKYGVLAIHKITADNLKAINDLRYYSGAGSLSEIDLSKYFASLKVIYCDVATDTSDAIIVSNINTNVIAPKVTDDYTILNLGNVSLAGEYQNTLDKNYSEITLNLPFVSAYKLDSAFMNETINIKYRVHLISGDVTVIISLVRNDTEYLIDTINGNMSFDLPFTYTINGETKPINANVNNPINFNVVPSVTIRQRLKADANNNIYQCYKIDTPANENGYFKIERLDADTIPASASIRNKIENLLKSGVYI